MIVTVFGSSRPVPGDPEYETARQLGDELARSGFGVCTGGYGGTMEAVSRGAAEAGGRVLAVTARVFGRSANRWVAEDTVVETWRDRLFKLIELGDAYVVLPGGTGTLAELAVVWEMLNKRVLGPRPLVLVGQFWRPLVDLVQAVENKGSPWLSANQNLARIVGHPRDVPGMLRS